ncbi:3-isopropylmalate dehydrogenase [Erythromicrobium ramosum]|uniref:3-isopropylmalate dehydrogenase n=1 Tax=Erythrobacter ramosus TaxID=35811 RepID=A0A6I4UNY1_9SPHN|nr:3-isopropylmalate dehydrogenase [Erythrobacter ramosus]MBB3775652.1 3-isopropylmalate dehydrogenase [Erythrobacter ramosus]MXP39249.1 3-isopropylmalate dehydrogenase [Erythrobacter ramosus]
MKIAVLPGDGIGPEVTAEAVAVLEALGLPGLTLFTGDVGGAAYHRHGHPLPEETLVMARAADAILFGAVGDPACDALERHLRPEQAILGLRKHLGLFANLRPARVFAGLERLSPLRADIATGLDMLIVRELTGDVYFGAKGQRTNDAGEREGWDAMSYADSEVRRIAHVAFRAAASSGLPLISVDKANVLETSQLWRDVVVEVAAEYPGVTLDHMYVDNAAMQVVSHPERFGVVLTGNLFGDILSDLASAAVGSIGLLPSASLGERETEFGTFGLYEPIHGSAPDIAGQGKANPMATILSAAMMLRHSFGLEAEAVRIETAVAAALADGILGGDLGGSHGTAAIGAAVRERL